MSDVLPEWLTVQQFADATGRTYSLIRRACIAGLIPGAYRLFSQWRIPRSAISAMSGTKEASR